MYNYSILLGILLALLGGALTVIFIEAHKKVNLNQKILIVVIALMMTKMMKVFYFLFVFKLIYLSIHGL
jgi:hypothetical protein